MEVVRTPIQYAELIKKQGPGVFDLASIQEIEKDIVIALINFYKSKPLDFDCRNTEDYKTYGILPGQELCHSGAFTGPMLRRLFGSETYVELASGQREPSSIKERIGKFLAGAKHCAIYLGAGMVAEVGGTFLIPKPSYKGYLGGMVQRFCISTLADFKDRAENTTGAGLIVLSSGVDYRVDVVLARLYRALHVIGDPLTYTMITANCQYYSGYVAYGTYWSQNQVSAAAWSALMAALPLELKLMIESGEEYTSLEKEREIIPSTITISTQGTSRGHVEYPCIEGACQTRSITDKSCVCHSPVKSGMRGKWCQVDGAQPGCVPEGIDKISGEWGWFKGVERTCQSTAPPHSIISCK
ncbi:MAG: hypothetical protein P4L69_15615 [Desulfosporosinus sp.]|nr:hypothetical protein [Desulfosporosinus sp.]